MDEDVILLEDAGSDQYYWESNSFVCDAMNSNEIQNNDLLLENNESVQYEPQTSQTQDTLYSCSICKKVYKSKYYVKNHEKKAHANHLVVEDTTSSSQLNGNESNPSLQQVKNHDLNLNQNAISEPQTSSSNASSSSTVRNPEQDVVLISDSDSEEDKNMTEYGTLTLQTNDTDFLQNHQADYIIIMNGDQLGEFPENGFLQIPDAEDSEIHESGGYILPDSNPIVATVKMNSNVFICDEGDCKMPFPHEKLLRNHKLMIHKRRSYTKCKFCKEGFLTKRDMKIHLEQSHENGNNKYRICGVCQEKFDDSTEFYQHFFTHPNANLCFICGKHFDYNTSLLLHQKTHRTHEKPRAQIICSICGMNYFLESSYQKHYEICCKILEEKKRHE